MSNGKFAKRKGIATKTMFMILAVVLIVGISVGGTLAWLTDTTDSVVNTFTTSGIDITLTETGATNNANSYKMVPGHTITKDPKATVVAGSEDCYLFVKLEKSTNFDNFMTYEIADGWTELNPAAGENYRVYYRVFDSNDSTNTNAQGTPYSILEGDQVTVKGTVTKEMMNGFDKDSDGTLNETERAGLPTLTVTAYASQLYKSAGEKFTPAVAWANVSNPAGSTNP